MLTSYSNWYQLNSFELAVLAILLYAVASITICQTFLWFTLLNAFDISRNIEQVLNLSLTEFRMSL